MPASLPNNPPSRARIAYTRRLTPAPPPPAPPRPLEPLMAADPDPAAVPAGPPTNSDSHNNKPLSPLSHISQLSPTPLDDSSKQLYLHHDAVVRALRGSDKAYARAEARAAQSATEANHATTVLQEINATEKRLTEQLEQFEAKKLRRRLFPTRTTERLTKMRNTLTAIVEEARNARTTATETRRQARAHAHTRNKLHADAVQLHESERSRGAILETVFGGLDVGPVHENDVEGLRDRLTLVTSQAKQLALAHFHAFRSLRAALHYLTHARRLLWDAQLSNTVDLFHGGTIGFIAGMGTQHRFAEAAKAARHAGHKIERALNINPKLPIAKLAKVHESVFLGLADIFLDGFVTDLVVRMTIEKAVRSVEEVMEKVMQSIETEKDVLEEAKGNFRGVSKELQRTCDELTRIRAELLQDAMRGTAMRGTAEHRTAEPRIAERRTAIDGER